MSEQDDRERAQRVLCDIGEGYDVQGLECTTAWEIVAAEFAAIRAEASEQHAALTAECERLRAALAVYANEDSWQCPRCHGSDSLNCGLVLWIGPVGMPDHRNSGVADIGDYHGWTVARAALRKESA